MTERLAQLIFKKKKISLVVTDDTIDPIIIDEHDVDSKFKCISKRFGKWELLIKDSIVVRQYPSVFSEKHIEEWRFSREKGCCSNKIDIIARNNFLKRLGIGPFELLICVISMFIIISMTIISALFIVQIAAMAMTTPIETYSEIVNLTLKTSTTYTTELSKIIFGSDSEPIGPNRSGPIGIQGDVGPTGPLKKWAPNSIKRGECFREFKWDKDHVFSSFQRKFTGYPNAFKGAFPSDIYKLCYQDDGNVVIYKILSNGFPKPIAASDTDALYTTLDFDLNDPTGKGLYLGQTMKIKLWKN